MRHEEYTYWPGEEENIESSRTEQPEWMDLHVLHQIPILSSTSVKILFMMMEDMIVNGFQNFSLSKGQKGIKLIQGLKISRPMFLFTSPAPLNGF